MNVKTLLRQFRSELNQVIDKDLTATTDLITVENLSEYETYLDSVYTETAVGKTIIFTSANAWYIPTLVKNLVVSINQRETFRCKFGVICSDETAYNLCKENNIQYPFLVKIPGLKVDTLKTLKVADDYIRLCFVKTVLAYHALKLGYNILYIDPDMAMVRPSLEYIIDQMRQYGVVLAGIKEGNMNTNVMGIIANEKNSEMFKVDVNTFEANLLNRSIYGRFCSSDEEFIIMKDEYTPDLFHYLDIKTFPPGNYVDENNPIMMLLANSVCGLVNKVNFMKKYNGWYL